MAAEDSESELELEDADYLNIPVHLNHELRLLLEQEKFGRGHRTPVVTTPCVDTLNTRHLGALNLCS